MIGTQDALERAYQQDVAGHRAEACKLYRLGIDTIYEGLSLEVPSAWLTGSNVNKCRSNLNTWLQAANNRYNCCCAAATRSSLVQSLRCQHSFCHCRLRDLQSPQPSTSAADITQTPTASRLQIQHAPNSSSRQNAAPVAVRKDRQSTAIVRQRSGPDRKKETAEEAKLREAVLSEVLDIKPSESWNDIAGLVGAKQVRLCLDLYIQVCAL